MEERKKRKVATEEGEESEDCGKGSQKSVGGRKGKVKLRLREKSVKGRNRR